MEPPSAHEHGTEASAAGYDVFAADYERHARDSAYNALYDRPAVLGLLGDDLRGLRVLDVGCGPGLYAEELVRRGALVSGFDQSPEMIRLARQRLGSDVTLRVHNLDAPLDWIASNHFDAAVMALVIHHVDDRVAALGELHRVLRPGGRLIVSTHHPMRDWMRLGGSYFDVEVVEEVWKRDWRVRYWRQPLTKTVDEFLDAGFTLDRLLEPLPHPAMGEVDPEEYELLSQQPGFIVFALRKGPFSEVRENEPFPRS